MDRASLTRFAWLSVGAAIATIGLKSAAYWLTGSVGLLSDAIESLVNLAAALLALALLTVAARPPDEEHVYGHGKAEYFASGAEGTMILLAAVSIAYTAIHRILNPQVLEQTGFGLLVSAVASLVNLAVARVLLKAGRDFNSITLEADARHLLTDVWTSLGVFVGVGLVALTGWELLDPILALAVALNIVWSGYSLVRRSILGLMDTALPAAERNAVLEVLDHFAADQGIEYHAVRTRQAGARRFVSCHILVPGSWSVQRGHLLLEQIEAGIRSRLTDVTVFTHLEPRDDPLSFDDMHLDRGQAQSDTVLE